MSKFVNYKKRSITLPPGCKDLIELLRPHRRPEALNMICGEKPAITRGESGTIKLSEVEKYVAIVFQAHGRSSTLMLSVPNERLTVDFAQMQGEMMYASAVFDEDADREQRMREFFVNHGLEVPTTQWTPTTFVAGVPVQLIFQISPLPADPKAASKLTLELFHEVCGLRDDSELNFHYYEIANTA